MNASSNPDTMAGRISRRRFLEGSLAAGAAASLGAPSAARAQPARPGGTLRLAFPNAPDTLDPQAALSSAAQQASTMIFDNLTDLDENRRAIPRLATRWAPEKGGQEWVFDLREGVKWHDGRDFTSADVVATLRRGQDRALGLRALGIFGPYRDIVAEGAHRVRFVLTQPFAELPIVCANRWARIIPAHATETLRTEPVGTGPFMYRDFQPGASMTVVKNPNYWQQGRPYLNQVVLVAIREAVAQQAALRGGSVDIVTQIPAETYLGLRNVAGVQAVTRTVGHHQVLFTQANQAPFTNPKVRQAFKYILDRRTLVASALLGQGAIGNDVPMPPGDPFTAQLPQYTQDLPRARALLNEAGIGQINLELFVTSDRPPSPRLGVALKDAAARIGVGIDVKDIPFTEYAANVSRKKPLYVAQWTGAATLYERLYFAFHQNGSSNYGGVENAPGLNAMLEDMIAEVDETRRRQIANQVQARIHEQGERIIPYFQNYFAGLSSKVRGFVPPDFDVIDVRGIWLDA